jgi:hypothetical protein
MRISGARIALVAIDGFAAVSAIGGGLALVTGLEGARFPVAWLHGTPFSSYTVPGLILAVVVGGSAAVAAVATLRNSMAGALASVFAGVIMLGWIVGEILILNQPTRPTWIEVIFLAVGVIMVLLGLALWRAQRRKRDG